MKQADARILTINGGSSSIKFALFKTDGSERANGRIILAHLGNGAKRADDRFAI
jgi:acetate kinase